MNSSHYSLIPRVVELLNAMQFHTKQTNETECTYNQNNKEDTSEKELLSWIALAMQRNRHRQRLVIQEQHNKKHRTSYTKRCRMFCLCESNGCDNE